MTGFCRCLWGSAVSDEWIHFQKCMVAVSYTIFVTEDCVGHSNRLRENQLCPKIADCSSIWIESRPGLEPVAWSLSCLGGSVSQAKTNTEAVHLSQAISRWVFSSVFALWDGVGPWSNNRGLESGSRWGSLGQNPRRPKVRVVNKNLWMFAQCSVPPWDCLSVV